MFFCYRGDDRRAALFVADLAAYLAPYEAAADYVLAAEWRPGSGEPTFQLTCPVAHIDKLAEVVLSWAFALSHDRYDRALRS
ncbi:MAG TPA: hypothetical protein VES65_01265 [Solirubrobacteraceae bacterium]|nr:hypothetical protein [Solirubrobacteraceae bacterium]